MQDWSGMVLVGIDSEGLVNHIRLVRTGVEGHGSGSSNKDWYRRKSEDWTR